MEAIRSLLGQASDTSSQIVPVQQRNIWSEDEDESRQLALPPPPAPPPPDTLALRDNDQLSFSLNIPVDGSLSPPRSLLGVPEVPRAMSMSESIFQPTWTDDRFVIAPGITQARVHDAERGQLGRATCPNFDMAAGDSQNSSPDKSQSDSSSSQSSWSKLFTPKRSTKRDDTDDKPAMKYQRMENDDDNESYDLPPRPPLAIELFPENSNMDTDAPGASSSTTSTGINNNGKQQQDPEMVPMYDYQNLATEYDAVKMNQDILNSQLRNEELTSEHYESAMMEAAMSKTVAQDRSNKLEGKLHEIFANPSSPLSSPSPPSSAFC